MNDATEKTCNALENHAHELSELLEYYAYELEEGIDHVHTTDERIIDELLSTQELLAKNEVVEGHRYQEFMMVLDHPIKLYEKVKMNSASLDAHHYLKVMCILSIKTRKDSKYVVNFLGQKLKGDK